MLSYVRAILEQHGSARDLNLARSSTVRTRTMGLLLGESDAEQIDELALSIIDGVVAYMGDTHINYVENEQVERLHREQVAAGANTFIVALTENEAIIFRRHLLESASFPELAKQLSICSRTARRVFERVSARLRAHLLSSVLI